MSTFNIKSEKIGMKYIHRDVLMFAFSVAFAALLFYCLDKMMIVSFHQQLAVLGHNQFPVVLLILFTFLAFIKTFTSSITSYTSVWMPMRLAVFTSFFIPIEQNGVFTSMVVETLKLTIKFLAN